MEKDLTNTIGYIYKVTSPNNKIYIGQTLNHKKRKSDYKYSKFIQQVKLWNSCECYNWNPSDFFEIIEECLCGHKKENLNDREIYWINFYDSFNNGLNCNEGGNGNTGHKHSIESKLKMRNSKLGVKHTQERNDRKSEKRKGYKHTDESKNKMSQVKLERMNDETKNKIRKGLIGNKNGIGNKGARKKIICLNDGIIYDSIKDAADKLLLHSSNIIYVCKGKSEQIKGYKFKYYEEKNGGF